MVYPNKTPSANESGSDIGDHLFDLVLRIQEGSEEALTELYDATVGQLYTLAYAILNDSSEAEDVISATYANAWSRAKRYDPSKASVFTWLSVMCRSRAIDALRKRRRPAQTLDEGANALVDESLTKPDDLLHLLQNQGRVYTALASLQASHRHLVAMSFLEGLSHQEIAGSTGMALGTVKSHIRTALLRLREELVEDE